MRATRISEHRGNFSPTDFYEFDPDDNANARQQKSNNGSGEDGLPQYSVKFMKESEVIAAAAAVSDQDPDDIKKSHGCQATFWKTPILAFQRMMASIFLPYRYPHSVSPDYLTYQIWDTLQAIFSSIANTFATKAIYQALGVGNSQATSLAAATVVLLQDASGWLGEIVFSWAKGRAFDYDLKKWRFFADVGYGMVLSFQLTYPLYPSEYMLYIFCGTSFLKAFQTIAGSATRVGLVGHQARCNNGADVQAKDKSQEQCVRIIGLGVSLALLHAFSDNMTLVWIIFLCCIFLHIVCNVGAIRAFRFRCFNQARLLYCMKQFLKTGKVPSIAKTNKTECFVIGFGIKDVDVCKFKIRMGVSIKDAFKFKSVHKRQLMTNVELYKVMQYFNDKPFLIDVKPELRKVDVVLHEHVRPLEMIEAYVRSVLVAHRYMTKQALFEPLHEEITEGWRSFKKYSDEEGYDFNQDQMGCGDWRAQWDWNSTELDIEVEKQRL